VAQLHRTVALVEVQHRASRIRQHLHLDVARAVEQALEEQGAVAERPRGFAAAAGEGVGHLLTPGHPAHAAPAAAGGRLQHHRIAERVGLRQGIVEGVEGAAAGHHRDVQGLGELAGAHLVAEQRQRLGRRADEGETGLGAAGGEFGILRQEAVARVHAVAAALPGGGDEGADVEVGAHRVAAAGQFAGFGRHARVQGVGIRRRVDGHRLHAEPGGGPGDADGDLATVGDQYALQHGAGSPLMYVSEPSLPHRRSGALDQQVHDGRRIRERHRPWRRSSMSASTTLTRARGRRVPDSAKSGFALRDVRTAPSYCPGNLA
jgi:hypothetical protein